MQLGVNLLCATGHVEEEHRPLLELATSSGFDGVEIPILEGSPEHYAKLGQVLDELHLRRTCTAIIPDPNADPSHADQSIQARGVEHLHWIADCAQALGAEIVGGPFYSAIGHFTGSGPTQAEWQRAADAHHAMADKLSAAGIKLAIEPLNRFETHFLNTTSQANAYCALVDHPAFGIMYDTFHAHIEEKNQVASIEALGTKLQVLHISENDRGIPGTGQIDFPAIFRAVKKTGFDDWVVLEAFGSGVPALAAATRIWRPMFDTHENLFKQSAKYIRDVWNDT